jgi:replicative DNA helicase
VNLATEQARRTLALHPDALPKAEAAEAALIDAALYGTDARDLVLSLPAGAITTVAYTPVVALMRLMHDAGQGCDSISLVEAAAAHGYDRDAVWATVQMVDGASTSNELAEHHARIIRETYEQRVTIQRTVAAAELMIAKPADARAAMRRLVDSSLDFAAEGQTGFVHASVAFREAMEDAERRAAGDLSAVIRTGVDDIDGEIVGGLEPGDLCTWVMVSGHGKTAALALVSLRAAMAGTGVGFVSAEMARRQIARRWIALLTGTPFAKLKSGELTREETARATYAEGYVGTLPLYIDDMGTPSLSHVVTQARRLVQRHPEIRVLVVDYVTLVQGTGHNVVEQYGQVIRAMKRLAKELRVAIIGLVQPDAKLIERRGADQQMPELADIAWSQEFRNQSDLIITGYRPGEYQRQISGFRGDDHHGQFMVRKSRNSAGGSWPWSWDGATMAYDGGCWKAFNALYAAHAPRLAVVR